ncbi:hypothetical protein QOZ98_001544 [Planomicrobium stackebrandtii]|uniref:Uncharacterized protein n=1 Tax=Planomicrobium stackebrandtii TaxID=253160 RepID=A0ABU0GTM9_9BACL|nr:hypothetical protein [Planomicrobium stackebrandtii]MDQ0428718.1 hypothetical protein [Planomicrobium stackebrandtii]
MTGMQKERPFRFAVWLWLLTTAVLLASGSWLLKTELPEAENLKTEIQAITIDRLGEKNNMNKERIDDISISRGLIGWNVEISLNADKSFTMFSTKQQIWQDAIDILEPLSGFDQLNGISLSFILPVENSLHKSVMSFRLDKATRDQLIWSNVDPSILPDITYDYQEHPVLNN